MQKQFVVVALLVALAAGCAPKSESTGGTSAPEPAAGSGDWSVESKTSGMDGEVVTATRQFDFDGRSTFVATLSCIKQTSALGLTIQSIVGDPENPTPASGFNANPTQLGRLPVGRVKVGSATAPKDLFYSFAIGEYDNQLKYIRSSESSSLPADLPMMVEVMNGAGTFELALDKSEEVNQVLSACGTAAIATSPAAQDQEQHQPAPDPEQAALEVAMAAADSAAISQPAKPSFDCAKASSGAERLICADPQLAKLDQVLATNYKSISASDIGDSTRSQLKAAQRTWLAAREACTDKSCVVDLYKQRIDTVCEIPVLSGIHPECTTSEEVAL